MLIAVQLSSEVYSSFGGEKLRCKVLYRRRSLDFQYPHRVKSLEILTSLCIRLSRIRDTSSGIKHPEEKWLSVIFFKNYPSIFNIQKKQSVELGGKLRKKFLLLHLHVEKSMKIDQFTEYRQLLLIMMEIDFTLPSPAIFVPIQKGTYLLQDQTISPIESTKIVIRSPITAAL
jgi:hypothetical protein